jgi:hypothetical protein
MSTKTENDKDEGGSPSFYENEENLLKLCDFLRTREGPPVREALLMEKRVLYLKGEDRWMAEMPARDRFISNF